MTRRIDFNSDWVEGRNSVRMVTGGTLMVSGAVVAATGFGLLALTGDCGDNGDVYDDVESESDLWKAGGLGVIGGIMVFGLGNWIYPDRSECIVHAKFDDLSEEELYEDVGYGAKRLIRDKP